MPTTFLGLALFVLFITPGYLWVRVEERSRPRSDRSQLLEVAELFAVGAAASLMAAAFVAFLGSRLRPFLDVVAWAEASDPNEYVAGHVVQALRSLLSTVLIANVAALIAAAWWFNPAVRRQRVGLAAWARKKLGWDPPPLPRIQPAHTPWFDVLGEVDKTKELAEVTVVENDGGVVTGLLRSYDVNATGSDQTLALQAPLKYQRPGGDVQVVPAAFVVISGGSMRQVFITVRPMPSESL